MNPTIDSITYVTRFEEVLWGCGLMAVSLVIHGLGMVLTLHLVSRAKPRLGPPDSFRAGLGAIILGSWMIMAVHILEILMWSAFLQWKDCFPTFSTAVYFTGLQYTTVGSALNLPKHWRLLEAMIASAGLLGFAWSTGVMMTLAQDFQEQQLRALREHRIRLGLHADIRKRPESPGSTPSAGADER